MSGSENTAEISRYYSVDSVPADDSDNEDDCSVSREVNGKHCDISISMNDQQQSKCKGSRNNKEKSIRSGNKDGTIVSKVESKESDSIEVPKSGTMEESIKDILSPTLEKTVDQILNESIETVSSLGDCPFGSSASSGSPSDVRRRGSSLSSQPVTDHPLMTNEQVSTDVDEYQIIDPDR